MIAVENDGRLILPWEIESAIPPLPGMESAAAELLHKAETAEFVAGNPVESADAYRAALSLIPNPVRQQEVRYQLARVLKKGGRDDEATVIFREIAALPSDLGDEEGIPLPLWLRGSFLRQDVGVRQHSNQKGAYDDTLASTNDEDMRVRNLSPKTIAIYVAAAAKFSEFFPRSPEMLGPEEIRTYQVHLVQEKKVSWSAFNIAVSALKFLYRVTLAKDWTVEKIPYAKKPKTKPVILSIEEVCTFLEALSNLKYRVLVMIAYATGLRHSEILHLRVSDIDSKPFAAAEIHR